MILPGSLWFLNIILLFFNIIFGFFLFLTQTSISDKFDIKNNINSSSALYSPLLIPKDLKSITESRDLFNTVMPIPEKNKKVSYFVPSRYVQFISPPAIPQELPLELSTFQEQSLLPPLQIDLHGTIISSNPMKNRAFLENTRSKEEKEYFIGDIVDDAQIIYIGKDKVTFVRSNGQEETIYLHQIFKIDDESKGNMSFEKIIQKKDNYVILNKNLFKYKVKSLSSFIDQLGLVTYFQKNSPIGCLIQNGSEGSLASALGLQAGDIIVSVEGIPTNTSESRMKIFELIHSRENSSQDGSYRIVVSVSRSNSLFDIYYQINLKEEDSKKKMGLIKYDALNTK